MAEEVCGGDQILRKIAAGTDQEPVAKSVGKPDTESHVRFDEAGKGNGHSSYRAFARLHPLAL